MRERSHELVAFENGTYSVKPAASTEAMHSHIGPWTEAEIVYVRQSRLEEKLATPGHELVLWDVGMGIAANALATVECFLRHPSPGRDLRILSFERHLDGLELALREKERFPWVSRHEALLRELLAQGSVSRPGPRGSRLRWELLAGNFAAIDLKPLPAAEIVFYDFYSPKTHPGLWTLRGFERLRTKAAPGFRLVTYCSSTAVRSALLLAGLSVGEGLSTQAKNETTVAALTATELERPLGRDWLAKLERSSKPLPPDWPQDRDALALERIRAQLAVAVAGAREYH